MYRSLVGGLALVSALCVAAGNSYAQTYYRSSGCWCGGGSVMTAPAMPAPQQGTAVQQQGAMVQQGTVAQRQPVQSYQRYSYSPAPTAVYSQPAVVGSAPMSYAPTYGAYGPGYRGVPDTSNYYRGGGYSRNVGNLWEYPKGDPRRQMH